MKRFDLVTGQTSSWLGEVPDGRFVSFDDHAAEVARLTAALEAAERRVLLQADAPELVRSHEALQARVAELEAVRYEQEQRGNNYCEAAMRAESELATAKARVAELEDAIRTAYRSQPVGVPEWLLNVAGKAGAK